MENRNIYALLVGIDKYPPPIPSLAGCVNDMLAVKRFLENRTQPGKLHLEVLMNEQATRMNVVEKFESHLGIAGPEDVAFFYYSGHGSQEPAHEVFWSVEPDKKNETLVCYDSRSLDGMDLADKELATLIEVVARKNPHFLVIMDCCNSGSGTRATHSDDEEAEFLARQIPGPTALRSLDSYILPRNLSLDRSTFVAEDQQIIVPEGRHVALSASQPFQLAKETRLGGERRGVFTYSLLEVLQQSNGEFSYADIMRRVRTLVAQRTYDQNPQLFAISGGDTDLTFLGGTIQEKGDYYLLSQHSQKGWIIDAGAVHGLSMGDSGERIRLAVYSDGVMPDNMSRTTALGEVEIIKIETTQSLIRPVGNFVLKPGIAYRTRILTLPVEQLKVCIRGNSQDGIKMARQALAQAATQFYIQEVKHSSEADLNLIAKNDLRTLRTGEGTPRPGYLINRPTDRDDQPLVEQIEGFNAGSAEKAIEYLNHIARWNRILGIHNPGSSLGSESVRIELYRPDVEEKIRSGAEGFIFSYTDTDGPERLPKFRLKIVNTGHRRLYCALLYLSSQYAILSQLFGESGVWLDSGQEAWAISGKVFTAKIAEELQAFGKNESHEIFKLFVSTEEFDASTLEQPALNLPKVQLRSTANEGDTRSLLFTTGTMANDLPDWNTNELILTIRKTV